MKVLIAEDDAVTRRILENAVVRLGHEPILAVDGQEAWERLQCEAIDVVIIDWQMPRLDGAGLCRRVRATQDRTYVYFIFLSILEDVEHVLAGMRAGADDYLPKPLDRHDLQVRLVAAERVTGLHRRLRRREAERERMLCRREALLRVARRLAAEGESRLMLGQLLAEVVAALDVDAAAVYAADERSAQLVELQATRGPADRRQDAERVHEAARLAVERREPVVLTSGPARGDGMHTRPHWVEVAAPLLHDGRVLGALTVLSEDGRRSIDGEDLEMLELLAGVASAALVGLERSQLKGVMLASSTIQHELNNHLAIASGYADCLASDLDLPPHLRELAEQTVEGVMRAAEVLTRLQKVTRIQETDWGELVPPTLDLTASIR